MVSFSYRNQKTSVGQPNFIGPISGTLFDTKLWNPSGKATYQINQNNKLIGYYQWGQKTQPNRLPSARNSYTDARRARCKQISGSWIYKGEWNGTINNNMYVEARYGVFGYYFPLLANSDTHARIEVVRQPAHAASLGADQKEQTDRQRRQATGSVTYFKDGLRAARTTSRSAASCCCETGWYGYHAGVRRQHPRERSAAAAPPRSVISVRADRAVGRQPRRRPERQPAEHRRRSTPSTASSPTSGPSAARR